jgi:hypothetical protein
MAHKLASKRWKLFSCTKLKKTCERIQFRGQFPFVSMLESEFDLKNVRNCNIYCKDFSLSLSCAEAQAYFMYSTTTTLLLSRYMSMMYHKIEYEECEKLRNNIL